MQPGMQHPLEKLISKNFINPFSFSKIDNKLPKAWQIL
jgi:hypothetical protein